MSKVQKMQRLIRHYKKEKGVEDVDMDKVVGYALERGWPLPKPVDQKKL